MRISELAEHAGLGIETVGYIDSRLADLQRMRNTLDDLTRRCAGRGDIRHCPIIAALAAPPARTG